MARKQLICCYVPGATNRNKCSDVIKQAYTVHWPQNSYLAPNAARTTPYVLLLKTWWGKSSALRYSKEPFPSGYFHSAPEDLKIHQMFSAPQYAGNLRFVFEETSDREIEVIHDRNVVIFEKFRFQNVFTKKQSQRFQIPPVWRAFSESSVFVTD